MYKPNINPNPQMLSNRNRPPKYYATNESGFYVHLDGYSFCKEKTWAWTGTAEQFAELNVGHGYTLKREKVKVK